MTQKILRFQWSKAHEKSFQALKKRLTTTLVLTLTKGTQGFVAHCDASRVCFGCILLDKGKVIAYASRKLKVHEKNCAMHDLELIVMVFPLKVWHHCLYAIYMDIFTEHNSNMCSPRRISISDKEGA